MGLSKNFQLTGKTGNNRIPNLNKINLNSKNLLTQNITSNFIKK